MALVSCSECGKQMSNRAIACPHCGNPTTADATSDRAPAAMRQSPDTGAWFSWIALATVFAMAYVLNPTPVMHEARLKQAMAARHPIASIFGAGQLAASAAKYNSVGVASYTVLDGKVMTLGIYGNVFLVR